MDKIRAYFVGVYSLKQFIRSISLYEKSNFGERKEGKIIYSPVEALYLFRKRKNGNFFQKLKELSHEELIRKFKKIDKKIQLKYPVFKDLREKGYVVKTALKFGAEFQSL